MLKKERIEWIDVAKGLAIICTMIGHYVSFGSEVRNFIFAFHMPLFFMLSGYTFKFLSDKKEMFYKTKNEIFRFLLPAFLLTIIGQLLIKILWNENNIGYKSALILALKRIAWGGGTDYNWKGIQFFALGIPWFLITLIIAKLMCNLMGKDKLKLSFILAFFGVFIGKQIFIIWNLDIVMLAIFYIYIGHVLKEKKDIYEKYNKYILIISIIFFSWMINQGKYIEIASRNYPDGMLSVIEAIAGSIMIIEFSKYICLTTKLKNILKGIGKISLIILLVHHFEGFTGIYTYFHADKIIIRIIGNILISYLISKIIEKWKFFKKNKNLDNLS